MDTQVLFFGAVAVSMLGQFSDAYTTSVGLSHGWTETIAAPAAVVKKFGSDGLTLIKGLGVGFLIPMLIMVIENHFKGPGFTAGSVAGFISAAGGFAAGLVNYSRLKAAKISLF